MLGVDHPLFSDGHPNIYYRTLIFSAA